MPHLPVSHLYYKLPILAGASAESYNIHFFLGPRSSTEDLNYDEPISHPAWIAQSYVMASFNTDPNSRLGLPDLSKPPEALPAEFLKTATRSSIPLTRILQERLQLASPGEFDEEKTAQYLVDNFHWRVGASDGTEIDVSKVAFRVWVLQEEGIPVPEGEWGAPRISSSQILWRATDGKRGCLRPGELPGVQ